MRRLLGAGLACLGGVAVVFAVLLLINERIAEYRIDWLH
jgi:hypothetical protein